jgi:hypothetical protein
VAECHAIKAFCQIQHIIFCKPSPIRQAHHTSEFTLTHISPLPAATINNITISLGINEILTHGCIHIYC